MNEEEKFNPEENEEARQWTVRHEPRHMLMRKKDGVIKDVFDVEQDNEITKFKIGKDKYIQAGAEEKKQHIINAYHKAEKKDIEYLVERAQWKIKNIIETKEVLMATLQKWEFLDIDTVPVDREKIEQLQFIIDGMSFYDGLTNVDKTMSSKTGEWHPIPGGSLANELYENVYEAFRPTGRTHMMTNAIVAEAGSAPLWAEEEKVKIKRLYKEHLDLQEIIIQGGEVKKELEKYADANNVPLEMRTDIEIRPRTINFERARLIEQVKNKNWIIDYVNRFVQFLDEHLARFQPYATNEKWSEIIKKLREKNPEPLSQ